MSADNKFELIYKSIINHFDEIKTILGIKKNLRANESDAILALIKSVYYVSNCLEINWDLIAQYWIITPNWTITDTKFAELQCLFMQMRCKGDQFSTNLKRVFSQAEDRSWFNEFDGWTKSLNILMLTLPLMVISIYTDIRHFPFIGDPLGSSASKPFWWPLLFEKAKEAKLNMFWLAGQIRYNRSQIQSKSAHNSANYIFI